MKLFIGIAFALLVLTGCSNTSGLNSSIQKDSYDGSSIVTMPAHGNDCKTVVCTGIGAQWVSKSPDKAILVINVFNEITSIDSAKISIDGKEYDIKSKDGYSNFDSFSPSIRNSKQAFKVDMAMIRSIASASDVRLKVYTSKGQISDTVISAGGDSKAYHAIRRFVDDVDKQSQ